MNKKDKNTSEMDWKDFLTSCPPNKETKVNNFAKYFNFPNFPGKRLDICTPEIELYCKICNDYRFFKSTDQESIFNETNYNLIFLIYSCKNCETYDKVFAIRLESQKKEKSDDFQDGIAIKLGEYPEYGDPTPSKLINIIGPDIDLYLKGRKCENQGMGLGAFSYYRRVVENQKNRILEAFIGAAKEINAKESFIKQLKDALDKNQFSDSIEIIKTDFPDTLKINGHNPLTLLHKPLSVGLHNKNDGECLELASNIRIILFAISNIIKQALKDKSEVKKAISRIFKFNSNK